MALHSTLSCLEMKHVHRFDYGGIVNCSERQTISRLCCNCAGVRTARCSKCIPAGAGSSSSSHEHLRRHQPQNTSLASITPEPWTEPAGAAAATACQPKQEHQWQRHIHGVNTVALAHRCSLACLVAAVPAQPHSHYGCRLERGSERGRRGHQRRYGGALTRRLRLEP